MQVVILAGGLGTRMRPMTDQIPKALIPVLGRPFAEYQIRWLKSKGVSRILFSIGYKGDMIQDVARSMADKNLFIDFISDGPVLLGTGGAIRRASESNLLEDRFFLMNGDTFLNIDLNALMERMTSSSLPAIMAICKTHGTSEHKNIIFKNGLITHYEKKLIPGLPEMTHIDSGVALLSRSIIDNLIPPNVNIDLSSFYQQLIQKGQLGGYEIQDRYFEIGSKQGLQEFEEYLNTTPLV